MRQITNLTDQAFQQHTIIFERQSVTLELRFLPQVQRWMINVSFQGRSVSGVFLALGVLHINNNLFPFDFVVTESSGTELDPFKGDDFVSRCKMYMLEPDEMEAIRGLPVAF